MTTQTYSAPAVSPPSVFGVVGAASSAKAGADDSAPQARTRVKTLAGDCWTSPPDGTDPADAQRPLLVCLTGDGRTLYPCWQFDTDDQPRPELAQVVASLVATGVSGWMIAAWLLAPRDDLAGLSPDTVLNDPHADHAAVYRLAAMHRVAPTL